MTKPPRKKQPEETKVEVTENVTPQPKTRSRGRRWFLAVSGSILFVLALAATYSFAYAQRIAPHTTIAGVAVGGLRREEAEAKVAEAAKHFSEQSLTLKFQGKEWSVKPADLGTSVATSQAVTDVWQQEKESTWQHQARQLFTSLFVPRYFEAGFTPVSTTGQDYFKKTVLQQIETPYQETSLSFVPGKVAVIPGKAGERLEANTFEKDLYNSFKKQTSSVTLVLEKFEPEISVAQAELARQQAELLLKDSWNFPATITPAITVTPTEMATFLDTSVLRDVEGHPLQLRIDIKMDALKKALGVWANQVQKTATNARLKVENNQVVVAEAGKNGSQLDIDGSLLAITSQLLQAEVPDRTLKVVSQTVQPEVRADTLAALGITELIGTATTDFSGSPTNRKFNITKGETSLDRQLLKDGDTFSTTGRLGPIEESTGYLPELVILGNRTVPEAGGGLCQVSTTLFRSVLSAGMPITERTNHAYRVSYYERGVGPGLDATIYDPSPDFKWKNDSGHAIFVQAHIEGTLLTFDLYGTKDGRVSSVSKPIILETYPVGPPLYSDTDTLDKGVTKQVETAHDGAKTTATYTVTRDGKEINSQTFVSVYKAWPAQFLVGTHEPASPPA